MRSKFVIFFFILLSIGTYSVKAETATVQYLEGIYSNRISDEKVYSGKLGYLMIDGKIVYCLEPYLIVGKDYEVNNDYLNHFSNEDIEYFELVAEYAKGHVAVGNPFYYMAAQELIWERIIGDKVYWTTEKNGNVEIDISSYKDEIESYVHNYYLHPSFDGTIIYDKFFTTYILEDASNILSEYEIVSETKSKAWIDGNNLYVTILSSEEEEIKLVRKEKEGVSTYYYSPTNQDLVDLSGTVMKEVSVKVQASNNYAANVMIKFFDEEFETNVNGGIKFKIHNLDTDEYSDEYTTYSSQYYYLGLEPGRYEIILLDVPKNYLILDNHYFEIVENLYNEYYQVGYPLKRVNGKLIINNHKEETEFQLYARENIYNIQNNIVYKKNDLITEKSILSNEIESIILPMGEYYLKDNDTLKIYNFELNYQDPFTEYVEYIVDIYEDKEDKKENNIAPVFKDDIDLDNSYDDNVESGTDLNEEENSTDVIVKQPEQIKNDISIEKDILSADLSNPIVLENDNNLEMAILPNTYDYIGIIKFILLVLLIISLINLKFDYE